MFFISIKPEEIFKVNQRIEIIVPGKDGLAEKYRSRIEDLTLDNMVIAMPMRKGFPVRLQQGEIFFGRTVVNHVAFEFTSALLARQISPLPIWNISLPYDIRKTQQRAFVRIDSVLPVEIAEFQNDEAIEGPLISAVTRDISGGGVQIVTDRCWSTGTKLTVTIHYPEIGPLTIRSQVVRVHQPQSNLMVFWVGVSFLEIKEKDRGSIIRLIFKKQLEQRRKGLE